MAQRQWLMALAKSATVSVMRSPLIRQGIAVATCADFVLKVGAEPSENTS